MAELKIIQFKSQKDINKERQEKLEQKKSELRRRVAVIKDGPKRGSGKAKVY
ncbi:hypothetical protein QTG56_25780 (plasmid) [Rossellomorea sp. AcN35-11]|nr:hypothetical protein [Rossellomorea aquimaris]WJV32027.1 hypothetical protein QTG56_25780 [Rossellomorea sp. AcN35-11]